MQRGLCVAGGEGLGLEMSVDWLIKRFGQEQHILTTTGHIARKFVMNINDSLWMILKDFGL